MPIMFKRTVEMQALEYRDKARKIYFSFFAAVGLPLSIGLIAGIVSGLFTVSCLLAVPAWRPYALAAGRILAVAVGGATWAVATKVWFNTWRSMEATIFAYSVPGAKGAKLSVTKPDGRGVVMPHFRTLTPAQLADVCKLVQEGKGVTYRNLRGITGSDNVTATFYGELIYDKEYGGWLDERNHQKGIYLNDTGRYMFENGEVLTPLPHQAELV